SPDHFIGIALGIIPVLLYYVLYARQVSLEHVFSILWDQSLQRTGAHHGAMKTLIHVFKFPVEQIFHFLPWSLLIIPFFQPRFRTFLRSNSFVHFNFWMLVANLPVYWLSVQVYPRYLLMFVPLFNLIGLYLLMQSSESNPKWWRYFHYLFLFLTGIIAITILLLPVDARVHALPGIILTWIPGAILILFSVLGLAFDSRRMFLWIPIALLVLRSVFDVVILPIRSKGLRENHTREDCRRLAEQHGEKTWYLFGETFPHEVARYYTSEFTNQIIRKTDTLQDTSAFYLVDPKLYPDFPGRQIDSLLLEKGYRIALMQVNQMAN